MSPDSKVHEANMGPIWGRQDPEGPKVGPMNFDIWVVRKMAAILSWPPCVNILRPSDASGWRIHTSLVYVIIYLDNSV